MLSSHLDLNDTRGKKARGGGGEWFGGQHQRERPREKGTLTESEAKRPMCTAPERLHGGKDEIW